MRKIIPVILINLLVLLVLAAGAELLFGHWLTSDPLDQLNLPRNQSTQVTAQGLYPGGGEFTYRRNRFGFRGDDFDPRRIQVMTLGGSTTNQLYLPEEQTWQAALARSLAEQGKDVAIANAGIDGTTTIGHIQALERWFPNVPGFKPKFVIAYVGINDANLAGTAIDRFGYSSVWKMLKQKSAILRAWAVVSGILQARKAKLNHRAVDFSQATWTDQPKKPDFRPDPQAQPAEYKKRVIEMARLIHELGAVPIFVTQMRGDWRDGKGLDAPDEELNGVDQHRLLSAINRATLAACSEQGYLCLDAAQELVVGPGDFYDYVHMTPEGAEKLGRWLAAKLAGLV